MPIVGFKDPFEEMNHQIVHLIYKWYEMNYLNAYKPQNVKNYFFHFLKKVVYDS